MDFKNLDFAKGSHCDCLNGASEDTTRVFIRRTGEKNKLKNGDFKPDVHKEGKDITAHNCKQFCEFRELSIDCLDGFEEEKIVIKYKEIITPYLKIAPDKKFYYAKFQFKTDSGVVKHTPLEGQDSHHDFYKSDAFTVDYIQPIGTPILINSGVTSNLNN